MLNQKIIFSSLAAYTNPFIAHLILAVCTLAGWWLAGALLEKSIKKLIAHGYPDTLLGLFGSVARKSLLVLGLIFAAGHLGFDITGILAGLGLTGFALGFAFKDALSNMIGGIFLLFYRPFVMGDTIKIETNKVLHEGRVISIDLRYTTLQGDKQIILIPNAFLLIEPIVISNKA
jgi:small-conductance mechanosensitive channel